MTPDPGSAEARLQAARLDELDARSRWYRTLNEVEARTSIDTLATRALEELRETGGALAARAVAKARARPLLTGAIAAGALALLFRKPIARGIGALFSRRRATRERDRVLNGQAAGEAAPPPRPKRKRRSSDDPPA